MFTVKHTSPAWEDNLYSATGVRFTPAPSIQTVTSPPETVWVRREETGVEFPITDGVIYVMNDAGATVAKYDLEAKRRSVGTTNIASGQIGGETPDPYPLRAA